MDKRESLKPRKGKMVEVWPIVSGFNHRDRGALASIGVDEVIQQRKPNVGEGDLRLHFLRTNP